MQTRAKQKGGTNKRASRERETNTPQIYSQTHEFLRKHATHAVAVGQGSRSGGPAVASVRDWEPGSLRAGRAEKGARCSELDPLIREGGGGLFRQLKHTGISRSDFI